MTLRVDLCELTADIAGAEHAPRMRLRGRRLGLWAGCAGGEKASGRISFRHEWGLEARGNGGVGGRSPDTRGNE